MVTPGDPEELRPTPLVARTRTAIYHALVTADPASNFYPHCGNGGVGQMAQKSIDYVLY